MTHICINGLLHISLIYFILSSFLKGADMETNHKTNDDSNHNNAISIVVFLFLVLFLLGFCKNVGVIVESVCRV